MLALILEKTVQRPARSPQAAAGRYRSSCTITQGPKVVSEDC